MENIKRWDFASSTINLVKMRAAYICSNPKCRLMTIGPSNENDQKVLYNGTIAHILPASAGGPRDVVGTLPEQRMHLDNAIFLCGSCAALIDKNNGIDFSIALLQKWKADHLIWISNHLNKQLVAKEPNLIVNGDAGIVVGVQHNYFSSELPLDPAIGRDRDNFLKLDAIADEEKVMAIFRSLKDYHQIRDSQQDILQDYLDFFRHTKHTFLAPILKLSAEKFTDELKDLMDLLYNHFDTYPYQQAGSDHKMELMPKVRHWTGVVADEEEKLLCRQVSVKLLELDTTVMQSYRDFRASVLNLLYI